MQRRTLGRTDLEIPVVVFGAWALGGTGYWGASDDELASAVQRIGEAAHDAEGFARFMHSGVGLTI